MRLPQPLGKQAEVLYYPAKNDYVILGTAGSGKTTLALHRAKYLATNEVEHSNEKVLLLTFNNALVTYFNKFLSSDYERLEINTYHKVCREYLIRRGYDLHNTVCNDEVLKEILTDYIEYKRETESDENEYKKNIQHFVDEIIWIQKMGIDSFEEYHQIKRTGRREARIVREKRHIYYTLLEHYRIKRQELGYRFDWNDMSHYCLNELNRDNGKRFYKYLIVDEGQDFSPTMIKSAIKMVKSEGSVMFLGDVAQQIYGSRISWRETGIDVKKIIRFEENYRNTNEIRLLANAIIKSEYFNGEEDIVESNPTKASGPKPTLVKFNDSNLEMSSIIDRAISESEGRRVAILFSCWDDLNLYKRAIEIKNSDVEIQILSKRLKEYNLESGLTLSTYYSAKGLEFDEVFIPMCGYDNFYNSNQLNYMTEDEMFSEAIKLLYVSVTRAKVDLIMSYSGEVTNLLPRDKNLYTILEV